MDPGAFSECGWSTSAPFRSDSFSTKHKLVLTKTEHIDTKIKTTDPLEFASWHAEGHTPISYKAPPHQHLHQHELKYFASYQTISSVLARLPEKLLTFGGNKHYILDTDKVP